MKIRLKCTAAFEHLVNNENNTSRIELIPCNPRQPCASIWCKNIYILNALVVASYKRMFIPRHWDIHKSSFQEFCMQRLGFCMRVFCRSAVSHLYGVVWISEWLTAFLFSIPVSAYSSRAPWTITHEFLRSDQVCSAAAFKCSLRHLHLNTSHIQLKPASEML